MVILLHSSRFSIESSFRSRVILMIAIVGVLSMRAVPPVFGQGLASSATFSCTPNHPDRAYFEHDGPAWTVPLSLSSFVLPALPALHRPDFTDSLPLSRETEAQYNRPPPGR